MNASQLDDLKKSMLIQFRENISDCKLNDSRDCFLLTWLIASNFELTKAEKMLRDSLDWRKENKVDWIRDELKRPELIRNYHPIHPISQDKCFNPLWLVRTGREDLRGLLNSMHQKDLLDQMIKLLEMHSVLVKNYPENRRPNPDVFAQATVIVDMEGFSMSNVTYKAGLDIQIQTIQIYQNHYPELINLVLIINAPKIFSVAFSILRRFMDERTANKIKIFSHDSDVWKPALLAEIDADQLPACYGGTMTDPDGNPNCISYCNMGGPVPKSFYLNNQVNSDDANENKKLLVLSPRTKEHLEFKIELPGSILRWNFKSGGDIGFAIYHKNESTQNNSLMNSVLPPTRTDIFPVEGEIECLESGLYVVEFDNSFSLLRSKKIWYAITLDSVKS